MDWLDWVLAGILALVLAFYLFTAMNLPPRFRPPPPPPPKGLLQFELGQRIRKMMGEADRLDMPATASALREAEQYARRETLPPRPPADVDTVKGGGRP